MESLCIKFWGIIHAYKWHCIFIYILAVESFQSGLIFKVALNLKIACLFSSFLPFILLIAHPLTTVKYPNKYIGSTTSEHLI